MRPDQTGDEVTVRITEAIGLVAQGSQEDNVVVIRGLAVTGVGLILIGGYMGHHTSPGSRP